MLLRLLSHPKRRAERRSHGDRSLVLSTTLAGRAVLVSALACFLALSGVVAAYLFYAIPRIGDHYETLAEANALAAQILMVDERLSMSAKMAVATGDERWIERFEESVPTMNGLLEDAQAFVPPSAASDFHDTVRLANELLQALQRRAFDFSREGQKATAQLVLDSGSLVRARELLTRGADEIRAALISSAQQRIEDSRRDAGLTLAAIILVGLCLMYVVLRRYVKHSEQLHARLDSELQRIALQDPLTRLNNRQAFERRLELEVLASSAEAGITHGEGAPRGFGWPLFGGAAFFLGRGSLSGAAGGGSASTVLVSLGLDDYRTIGERHGHVVADTVLSTLAARLNDAFSRDYVARVGNDEFMVLARSRRDDLADILRRVEMVLDALAMPLHVDTLELQIASCAGVARLEARMEPQDLRRAADLALGAARAQSKNDGSPIVVFTRDLQEMHRKELAHEERVRRALALPEFVPYFQPLVDINTGRAIGAEALARWVKPDGTVLGPGAFMPRLEAMGRLPELTWIILEQAARCALTWPEPINVAVNVEPTQLRPDFARRALALLERVGLPPSRVVIEVLETALVQHCEETRTALEMLRSQGIRIALDDFGVGYSSLGQLSVLPIDKLKVDRSFVAAMHADGAEERQAAEAVVRAALDLGRSCNLRVVAEGVESESDVARLKAMGCSLYQGFVFAKPLPPADLLNYLSDQAEATATSRRAAAASAREGDGRTAADPPAKASRHSAVA